MSSSSKSERIKNKTQKELQTQYRNVAEFKRSSIECDGVYEFWIVNQMNGSSPASRTENVQNYHIQQVYLPYDGLYFFPNASELNIP